MRMTSGFWGKWGSLRGKKHLFAASKRGFFPLKKIAGALPQRPQQAFHKGGDIGGVARQQSPRVKAERTFLKAAQ